MDLSEFWTYIERRLGLFLVASRFKTEYDKESCKLFKLLCLTHDSMDPIYKINHFLNENAGIKRLIELKTKGFLNDTGAWDYEELYRYISEFEKAGELYIGTPFELIDEILDKIFTEDYVNKLIENYLETGHLPNILDPACGRGRFLFKIKERLMRSGFDEKEVIEHFYGIDIDPKSVYLTRALIDPKGLCEKSNIYLADTLNDFPKELKDMKFDIVIGNPPFQDGENKGGAEKLWTKFVALSVDNLLKDDGYLGMITPAGWMSATANVKKGVTGIYKDYFGKYSLKHVDVNDVGQKYFQNVGSTFCYFIFQKTEVDKCDTTWITKFGKQVFDIRSRKLLISSMHPIMLSIFDKTLNNGDAFSWISLTGGDQVGEKGLEFPTNDIKIKHYIYGGNDDAQYLYFSKDYNEAVKSIKKVVIPRRTIYKFAPFVDYDNTPICVACYVIPLEDASVKEYTLQVFNSKLFKFLVEQTRMSNFVAPIVLKSIPKLDLTRPWTDQEIYEYFGLTEEEIKLIEESVK